MISGLWGTHQQQQQQQSVCEAAVCLRREVRGRLGMWHGGVKSQDWRLEGAARHARSLAVSADPADMQRCVRLLLLPTALAPAASRFPLPTCPRWRVGRCLQC